MSSSPWNPFKEEYYNPFDGPYDPVRFRAMLDHKILIGEEYAIEYFREIQLSERIADFYARGYHSDENERNDALPGEVKTLLSVCEIIARRSTILYEEKYRVTAFFLSLRPPILQEDVVHTYNHIMVKNGDSSVLRHFLRYYTPLEWKPLITDNIQLSVGESGETDLFDIFVSNDVQPKIIMVKGALMQGNLDIIDRFFLISSTPTVKALHPDADNERENKSLFCYAIDCREKARDKVVTMLDRLFMYGANPNGNGTFPLPLEEAFYTSKYDAAMTLLDFGADPNIIVQRENLSLIMSAVWANAPLPFIKALVLHGADVNSVHRGKTALSLTNEGEVRNYLLPLTKTSLRTIPYGSEFYLGDFGSEEDQWNERELPDDNDMMWYDD